MTDPQTIYPVTSATDRARASMLYPPDTVLDTPIVSLNNRLANDWLAWLRDTKGCNDWTCYTYAGVIVQFLDGCVGNRTLDQVTEQDVEQWLLRPRRGRAMGKTAAPATRSRNIAILRGFYKWLHVRGLTSKNLGEMLVAPKVSNRQPKAIPDQQWDIAWAAPMSDTTKGILALGFFLGLRRAEMHDLRTHHVDTEQRRFRGFPRKGGGDDTLPAWEVLTVWQSAMPERLGAEHAETLWQFVADLAADPQGADGRLLDLTSIDAVNRNLKGHLKRLGMVGAFTPHALRHSFITNLLRCDMPIHMVSELANHSSLDVTMRYVKGGGNRVTEWLQKSLAPPTVSVSDWR